MAGLSLASVSADWHERLHSTATADSDCDHHHDRPDSHPAPFDHSDDGCAICKMAAGQLTHLIDPPQVTVGEPNSRFLPRAKDADVPASTSTSSARGRAPPRLS
jgi:hypothetical protein